MRILAEASFRVMAISAVALFSLSLGGRTWVLRPWAICSTSALKTVNFSSGSVTVDMVPSMITDR